MILRTEKECCNDRFSGGTLHDSKITMRDESTVYVLIVMIM